MKSGESVLTINNKEAGLRILQVADRLILAQRPELKNVLRKQQNTAGNGGLRFGGLIEVHDFTYLATAEEALKRLFAAFDGSNKFGNGIIRLSFRFDRFPFKVKAAGKTNSA